MDHQSSITPWDLECMLCDETADPKALPLSLLEEITYNFSNEQRIGTGGFAVVYKGILEKRTVAVKRMSNTYMYEKEFQREVECLMMVKHKNVVRFLGYCADTQGSMEKYDGKFVMADVQQRLLCFEYLPKGSLHEYITDTSCGLRWRDRYQIITGICKGLHYLHQKNILHLDLKPANILLDDNWVPKITDFGISRCFDQIKSQVITTISGTPGYLAPESFNHTDVTYRNSYRLDIYSLGVVIIEILTGKKGYHDVDEVVKSWSGMLEESQSELQLAQINPDMLVGTMRALWLSYQQLNPNIRRCMEYCSIFPKGSKLRMVDLVRLWIAQGFVKTSCATEDMEDVAEGYIQELVSYSFLQPEGTSSDTDCFTIHDMLYAILDKVAGNCFRIENASGRRGEGWEGDVPRDVQHLLIQYYDGELITEKILGSANLRTLIVYVVEDTPVEEKVIESICKRLPKLRVLAIPFSKEHDPIMSGYSFSVPESISQLKHLCYLAFRTKRHCTVILPSTLKKLRHIQVLDFGDCNDVEFIFADLINLRHIVCSCTEFPNIGRLISLQTLPEFRVRDEPGYEVKQLRAMNKLRGTLEISGLEYVKSKEEALEANLAAKERLTEMGLKWDLDYSMCSPEVEAEVLEGMCPPVGLQTLWILGYRGSRYPDWMVGKQDGGPKDLQHLAFCGCIQLGPAPQLVEAFPHLRVLTLYDCSWDALPSNMEHLTSLMDMDISECKNIRSLPTLPQSLEEFRLNSGNSEFMKSCITVGHPNWQKIEHIPKKTISGLSTKDCMEAKILSGINRLRGFWHCNIA